MSAASNFLESALLEHFRGTQLPLPSGFYIALHTTDPTDAASETRTSAWSRTVQSASPTNAFGVPAPRRVPLPAATTITPTDMRTPRLASLAQGTVRSRG